MLIDFKEIPRANTGCGDQDEFEMFARDFLSQIGYVILEDPARGADGGKDLIVGHESAAGPNQSRWLVSCKHFAHGGKSVTAHDEINILERTKSHACAGFLGFYSTLPSEGLLSMLRRLSGEIRFLTFDREKIESLIVGYRERENLFLRYFPSSYKNWRELHYYTEPVSLFNFFYLASTGITSISSKTCSGRKRT